jgi:hypothetical protein
VINLFLLLSDRLSFSALSWRMAFHPAPYVPSKFVDQPGELAARFVRDAPDQTFCVNSTPRMMSASLAAASIFQWLANQLDVFLVT